MKPFALLPMPLPFASTVIESMTLPIANENVGLLVRSSPSGSSKVPLYVTVSLLPTDAALLFENENLPPIFPVLILGLLGPFLYFNGSPTSTSPTASDLRALPASVLAVESVAELVATNTPELLNWKTGVVPLRVPRLPPAPLKSVDTVKASR